MEWSSRQPQLLPGLDQGMGRPGTSTVLGGFDLIIPPGCGPTDVVVDEADPGAVDQSSNDLQPPPRPW